MIGMEDMEEARRGGEETTGGNELRVFVITN